LGTIFGLFSIQEIFNWTDEEALEALLHNNKVQYALAIPHLINDEIYISARAYAYHRAKLTSNSLGQSIFNSVTLKLVEKYNVELGHQRLDSVNIKTNMKKAGRLGLMSATVKKFLKSLNRLDREAYDSLDPELLHRYLPENSRGYDYFGQVKPEGRQRALETVANDMLTIIVRFEESPTVGPMKEFSLLTRVFNEQCVVASKDRTVVEVKDSVDAQSPTSLDEDGVPVYESIDSDESSMEPDLVAVMKDPKDVRADSVQFPSDTDATYNHHKKEGLHVQLGETYTPVDDPASKPLNLITHVEVHGAHVSDNGAVETTLEDLAAKGLMPETLTADTAYGADANYEFARERGVELIAPVPGQAPGTKAAKTLAAEAAKVVIGLAEAAMAASFARGFEAETALENDEGHEAWERRPLGLADFYSSPRGEILYCPMGQGARTRRNEADDGGRAYFDSDRCAHCPRRWDCPVKSPNEFTYLIYKDEQVRIAKRRAYQQTDEFKDAYRWRSGIEGTNSQLGLLGGKKLRVRGLLSSTFRITLKALAINCKRLVKFKARNVGLKTTNLEATA
jgi:hypothetical protein